MTTKSNAQHTPGPWFLGPCSCGMENCRKWMSGPHPTVEGSTSEADARLIAAAPELLEALQAVLDNPKHYATGAGQSMLRAAIAKATGGGQ